MQTPKEDNLSPDKEQEIKAEEPSPEKEEEPEEEVKVQKMMALSKESRELREKLIEAVDDLIERQNRVEPFNNIESF